MTVDIIIPAYNAHKTIGKTLASIAMQKLDEGDSINTVIVDDASPDGDYHDIAEYWAYQMPITVFDKTVNAGCGQARQTGIDNTDGDFFMFIDADDTLGSPFAVRTLLREIKNDNDMVMGMFVEETADGKCINHEANYIWCHGKMYRRSFIKEHDIHFNYTRGNEDVGFNSVLHALTDKVSYIPQVVYIWLNQGDSLVRDKRDAYAYDYGWRDFIDNMEWAADEMKAKGAEESGIVEFLSFVTARLYFQFEQAHEHFPEHDDVNLAALCSFYENAVKPYVDSGKINREMLRIAYFAVKNDGGDINIIPTRTYDRYLRMIGFEEA